VPEILAQAVGGTIGDALFTGDTVREHAHLVRYKVIGPVDGYLDGAGVEETEWLTLMVDQLTDDGEMHGLPRTGHPGEPFIWVNLTMFDKPGIDRPAVKGNTFDDVQSWTRALTKGPEEQPQVTATTPASSAPRAGPSAPAAAAAACSPTTARPALPTARRGWIARSGAVA
jgi:hypothetical protein